MSAPGDTCDCRKLDGGGVAVNPKCPTHGRPLSKRGVDDWEAWRRQFERDKAEKGGSAPLEVN